MSEQKYYCIVTPSGEALINMPNGQLPIFETKTEAETENANWWKHSFQIIPIPTEELHVLIKKHAKK